MGFNFFVDNSNPWIGFWGNLVGAFLAAAVAIIVMWITTKQTREIQEENKRNVVKPILIFNCTKENGNMVSKFQSCGSYGIAICSLFNVGNGWALDICTKAYLGNDEKCLEIKEPNVLQNGQKTEISLESQKIYELKEKEKLRVNLTYKDIFKNEYETIYIFELEKNIFKVDSYVYKD